MLTLAFDTTGKSLSVALTRDGRQVGESRFNLGYNHALTHLPQVVNLLKSCEIDISQIDLFACTKGPGSYTGTRIGVAACKAMAYAAGKPVVGVSTLLALAWPWRHWPGALLCPALDARNGRVFAAVYRLASPVSPATGHALDIVIEPGNYSADDLVERLASLASESQRSPQQALLTGDGAQAMGAAWLAAESGKAEGQADCLDLHRLDPLEDAPRACFIAALAEIQLANGDSGDAFLLDVDYLAPSSAERLRAAHGAAK